MKNSYCQVCQDPVPDHAKRFVQTLGFCCPECYDFSLYSEMVSLPLGIEGAIYSPIRYSPKPETEEP